MLCLFSFINLFNFAISSIFSLFSFMTWVNFRFVSNNLLFNSKMSCWFLFISSSFCEIFSIFSFFSKIKSFICLDNSACSLFKFVIILSLFVISVKSVFIFALSSFNWLTDLLFSCLYKESLFFSFSSSCIRDKFFVFNSLINKFNLFDSDWNLFIKAFFSLRLKFNVLFWFSKSFKFIFIFFWLLFNSSKIFSFCLIWSKYDNISLFKFLIWFSKSSISFLSLVFSSNLISFVCLAFFISCFNNEFSCSNDDIFWFKLFSDICCILFLSDKYFMFISFLFISFNKEQHLSKYILLNEL